VSGFRRETAERLVTERERAAFTSIDDLVRRVPALSKKELNSLADLSALNSLGGDTARHRRDAPGTRSSLSIPLASYLNRPRQRNCLRRWRR
jgi:hypothetical protein